MYTPFCMQYSPYTIETEGEGLGLLLCDTPGIGRESGNITTKLPHHFVNKTAKIISVSRF